MSARWRCPSVRAHELPFLEHLSPAAIESVRSRSFVRRAGLERWLAAHGIADPSAACDHCQPKQFTLLTCVGSTQQQQQQPEVPEVDSSPVPAAACVTRRDTGWRPERAVASVLAALVADAASQTSHWRYDTEKLWDQMKREGSWEKPEFVWPRVNKTYALAKGEFSCYGDQMIVVLHSVVSTGGIDTQDLLQRTMDAFDEHSPYGPLYEPLERPPNRPWEGGWRHNSLHEFAKRVHEGVEYPECGASDPRNIGGDSQVDCILRVIPVVALYAGTDQMMARVHDVVKLTQNNSKALTFAEAAARLLELCILGEGGPAAAIEQLQRELSHVEELEQLSAKLKGAKFKERRVLRDKIFDLEKSGSRKVSWKLDEALSHQKSAPADMPYHTLATQAGRNWQSGGIA